MPWLCTLVYPCWKRKIYQIKRQVLPTTPAKTMNGDHLPTLAELLTLLLTIWSLPELGKKKLSCIHSIHQETLSILHIAFSLDFGKHLIFLPIMLYFIKTKLRFLLPDGFFYMHASWLSQNCALFLKTFMHASSS